MAMWKSCTVTGAGAQLLMKMQALEIYAARYGTETVDEDELKFQEDVSEPGGIMSIVELKPYDWGFEIVIRMDNSKLSEETVIRQMGFFARIKGSDDQGVLFAIAQDETGDRVPTPEDMPNFNLEFTIAVAADSSPDISIVIDPTATATVGYVATVRHEIEMYIHELQIEVDKKPDVHVIATRIRDQNKPDYGLADSGEYKLRLNAGEYTGNAEIAIVRDDNSLLDADNMTLNAKTAKDGDFIVNGNSMDNTKFVLEKVKVNGEVKKLVARSDGDHTTVSYKGKETTLNASLASIETDMSKTDINVASDSEVRDIFNTNPF